MACVSDRNSPSPHFSVHTANMCCVTPSVRQKMLAHSASVATSPCFSPPPTLTCLSWSAYCGPTAAILSVSPFHTNLLWNGGQTHSCLCIWRPSGREEVWNINSLGLQYGQWGRWDLMEASQTIFLFSVFEIQFSTTGSRCYWVLDLPWWSVCALF